jgi:hypothetical protein
MELTAEQQQAVDRGEEVSIFIKQTECVVIRKDVYDRIKGLVYDDSLWAEGETNALALQTFEDADTAGSIE